MILLATLGALVFAIVFALGIKSLIDTLDRLDKKPRRKTR